MTKRNDIIDAYFEYTSDTECPKIFHRWSILSAIGAYLGRQVVLPLGQFKIYPNMYTMLIGVPGTRKSTAIKLAKKLIKRAGYDTFSADKSSKEKFILDLAEGGIDDSNKDKLDVDLFGKDDRESSEVYIAADEFNNFIGNGNLEFISLLGEWWDFEGPYGYRIKNGKSVVINNPTINILGGNTSTGFSLAFPSQVIGQGFFSRLLLIYSEPSSKRITFPKAPSEEVTSAMVENLLRMKLSIRGEMQIREGAKVLLDVIYNSQTVMDDVRFEHYANRRFTHLLKLCMIVAAARISIVITEEDVIYANTILTHAEQLMPKALGQFGSGKYSDVQHKIISLLESVPKVFSQQEIWKAIAQDVDKFMDLGNILQNLHVADKIIRVEGGFLAKRKVLDTKNTDVLNFNFLHPEELSGV